MPGLPTLPQPVTPELVLVTAALSLCASLFGPCLLAFILFLLSLRLQRNASGPNGEYSPLLDSYTDEGEDSGENEGSYVGGNQHAKHLPLQVLQDSRRHSRDTFRHSSPSAPPSATRMHASISSPILAPPQQRFEQPRRRGNGYRPLAQQRHSLCAPAESISRGQSRYPYAQHYERSSDDTDECNASNSAQHGHHQSSDAARMHDLHNGYEHQTSTESSASSAVRSSTSSPPKGTDSQSDNPSHGIVQSTERSISMDVPRRRETPYPHEQLEKLAKRQALSPPCRLPLTSTDARVTVTRQESSLGGLLSLLNDTGEDFLSTPIKSVESDIQRRLDLLDCRTGSARLAASSEAPLAPETHIDIADEQLAHRGSPSPRRPTAAGSTLKWQPALLGDANKRQLSLPPTVRPATQRGAVFLNSSPSRVPRATGFSSSISTGSICHGPALMSMTKPWTDSVARPRPRASAVSAFQGPRTISAGELYSSGARLDKPAAHVRRVSLAMPTVRHSVGHDRKTSEDGAELLTSPAAAASRSVYRAPLITSRLPTIKHRPDTPLAIPLGDERDPAQRSVSRRGGYPTNSTPPRVQFGENRSAAVNTVETAGSSPSDEKGSAAATTTTAKSSSEGYDSSEKENRPPLAVPLALRHQHQHHPRYSSSYSSPIAVLPSSPSSFISTPQAELEANIDEMLLHCESSASDVRGDVGRGSGGGSGNGVRVKFGGSVRGAAHVNSSSSSSS